ncbi:hypothetical protein [Rhizobium tubonense]|nr:hypothetical protein [Rhizobium tubonense]
MIKFFRSVRFKNDWELNFIGKRYNLRIGRSQFAFWRDYNPIFNWLWA